MCLAWTIHFITPHSNIALRASSYNCIWSLTHTLTHTQWFLRKNIRAFSSNFCNSFSVNHCGVHARRVRLPEMRLPLIKILVWGRAAFNVTQDIHALLQGQHAVAPSKHCCTTTPQKAGFISTCIFMGEPYLHFIWCKHLNIYFAGDDGHHLQFHIYRWHSLACFGFFKKN